MGTERFTIATADGRSVPVIAAGPPEGLALVLHTGTPAGLIEFTPLIDAAAAIGLRTVMYARPGYGVSDALPGRGVADAAADVAAVLEHIGAGRFVTAGWSGGGPHALATAAVLGDRCAAAATIAGWRDDDLAFVRDWGIDLDMLTVPVSVWQGDQDAMVPLAHGEWLARRITNAHAHLLPGEGHYTLVSARIGDILRDLASLASDS